MMIQIGMNFDSAAGGADRYFRGLLAGFDAIQAPYTAAAFGEGDGIIPLRDWEPGVLSTRVSLGSAKQSLFKRWGALRLFGRDAFSGNPTLLATHFALYAAPILSVQTRTPHVVHFHGPWAGEAKAEGAKPWVVAAKAFLERRVFQSAQRMIVLSTAFKELLVRDYGVAPERIVVIPGGVDTERFIPVVDRSEARRKLGWPEGKKIIFCVRRMVRRMGLEDLIDAFARVAPAHPDAVLILGGRGPVLGELQERAAELGLSERILFPGFLREEDLPSAYAAADFTMVPSRTLEGFGLVTLESLACGTPVLVTPVGGLPETISGLDRSLVLPDFGVESLEGGLAKGLRGDLPSPDQCREYVEKSFTWERIARRVLAVYQECGERRR